MEVPRLGVESKLQLPAYTTATATPNPSCICHLCCSSRQRRFLNPLSEAKDGISAPSQTLCQVLNPLSHSGNSAWCSIMLCPRAFARATASARNECPFLSTLLSDPSRVSCSGYHPPGQGPGIPCASRVLCTHGPWQRPQCGILSISTT